MYQKNHFFVFFMMQNQLVSHVCSSFTYRFFSNNVYCVLPSCKKQLHETVEYAKLMQCVNKQIIKQEAQATHRVTEQQKS